MKLREKVLTKDRIIIAVSITNHIIMSSNSSERTNMHWDDIKEFNRINEGKTYLFISNLVSKMFIQHTIMKQLKPI